MQTPTPTAPAGQPDLHRSTAAKCATLLLMALCLLVLACQLAACGGGGADDDNTVPTPAVDCKAAPEQCR